MKDTIEIIGKEKKERKLDIGLLYISLHSLLRRKYGINRYISRKDFYTILGKHFLIPKNIRIIVIKEMENRGLVKQESKEDIKILDCNLDIENNTNEWFQKVGIF